MGKPRQQIVDEIRSYIARRGGELGEWQVALGTNERARLFDDHRVRKGDSWIVRRAESPQAAREASLDLAGILKKTSALQATETTADFVYAFRKAAEETL